MNDAVTPISDEARDQLLLRWMQAQKDLAAAKEYENQLRNEIFERLFADAKEGVNNLELGQGYTLKCDYKFNYKLSNKEEDGRLTEMALQRLIAISPPGEGALLAKRLVKWSPELSIGEYRKLSDEQRAVFGQGDTPALVVKPGLPSITLVPPKNAK